MGNKQQKPEMIWPRWTVASDLEDAGKVDEAIKIYLEEAHRGDTVAQSNLGNILDRSTIPSDRVQAVYWYKRAVRGGNSTAAWNLAIHHRILGSTRWYLHWLKKAAGMGDDEAIALVKKYAKAAQRSSQ